jgi:hypothetical protein
LKDQVTALQSTVETMNKAFLAFSERILASNVLQNSPDLAKELRDTTEGFLAMAKTAGNNSSADSDEFEPDKMDVLSAETAPQVLPRPTTNSSNEARMVDIGMGYVQIVDEAPVHGQLTPPEDYVDTSFPNAIAVPPANQRFQPFGNSDFTLFPATVDSTQPILTSSYAVSSVTPPSNQYNLESDESSLMKLMSIPAPYTFSVNETTFARRLQRAGYERAFHILSKAESRPETYQRVFRLSLPFNTRETLIRKVRYSLTSTNPGTPSVLCTPFLHLGGAGTHYTTSRTSNSYIVTLGPHVKHEMRHDLDTGKVLDIDLREYEGEWFDSNDVEGFLLELGVAINPRISFAEATVEESGPLMQLLRNNGVISDSPRQSLSWSSASPVSPSNVSALNVGSVDPETLLLQEMGIGGDMNSIAADATAAAWLLGSGDKTPPGFLSSGWTGYEFPSPWDPADALGDSIRAMSHSPELVNVKRKVTLDVGGLIDCKSCYDSLYEGNNAKYD